MSIPNLMFGQLVQSRNRTHTQHSDLIGLHFYLAKEEMLAKYRRYAIQITVVEIDIQ
jgi:hypothetical protein